MKTLLLTVLALSLLVAACAHAPPTVPSADQANPSAETVSVDAVQANLATVDTLDQDLNFSDLDSLDTDLNFG